MTREGDAASDDPWIYIGRVARPHGVRGAVKLHLENPGGELLRDGLVLRLEIRQTPAGKPASAKTVTRDVTITRVYGGANVDLEDVGDRDAAEALRDARVHVRRSEFPAPGDDETYLVDLIGCEVRHTDGRLLGVLESFSDNRAQPLAEVRTPQDEGGALVLVPFVPGIVADVSESRRLVVLAPPLGLFEELADDDEQSGAERREPPPSGGTEGEP